MRVDAVTRSPRRSRRRPGVTLAAPKPLVVPILRAGLGMLDGMIAAAADRRGRLPRHDPRRGDARGLDVRRPAARRPVRPAVLRARPDARHRRHAGRGDPVPHRPRRRRHHRDLPAGRARGLRPARGGPGRARRPRHRRHRRRWTRSSTRRATSCPASATPATGSTASSDGVSPTSARAVSTASQADRDPAA